jgi:hypothetical protein
MNKTYKTALIIAFVSISQNALACAGLTSAHCNLKIEHTSWNPAFSASPNTFNQIIVNPAELPNACYNQQTQNQKCITDATANLNSGLNIIKLIKDSAIQAGVCEEANYAISAGAGTNTKTTISNGKIILGGIWHQAVTAIPSSCPTGYSFPGPVGPYCVIDIVPTAGIDTGAGTDAPIATKSNARVKQTENIASKVDTAGASTNVLASRRKLICATGYTLSDAGYKPGKVCRKQTSAYPGSPAVAAHCSSSSNN